MVAPKIPDAKDKEGQKKEQKKEQAAESGLTAQKVMAEMVGLGLVAHLVEAGEANGNGQVSVVDDSVAVRPKDQLNPNRSFKPR